MRGRPLSLVVPDVPSGDGLNDDTLVDTTNNAEPEKDELKERPRSIRFKNPGYQTTPFDLDTFRASAIPVKHTAARRHPLRFRHLHTRLPNCRLYRNQIPQKLIILVIVPVPGRTIWMGYLPDALHPFRCCTCLPENTTLPVHIPDFGVIQDGFGGFDGSATARAARFMYTGTMAYIGPCDSPVKLIAILTSPVNIRHVNLTSR